MASSTRSNRLAVLLVVVAAVVVGLRWRALELAREQAERRTAELEKRTAALSSAVEDLQARPPTRIVERGGPPPPWTLSPPQAPPAAGSSGSSEAPGDASAPESKDAIRLKKRETFERLEREFAAEPVDPAWSKDTQRSLSAAIRSLPAGLASVDSVVSKSQRSRIQASFASAAEYNEFVRTLFMLEPDPNNPGKVRTPLFTDQGGVFIPYKEEEDDGRFHAVVYVDRPHGDPPRN